MAQPAPTTPISPSAPNPTETPPTTTPPTTPSFAQRLNAAEPLGVWKCGLRALTTLLAVIGIGALAWVKASHTDRGLDYDFDYQEEWALPWGFITFGIGLIWCLVWLLVLLIRRRGLHPGWAVGFDLLLFLGYLGTALLVMVVWIGVYYFGQGGTMGMSYSSDGAGYKLYDNGTWIWQAEKPAGVFDEEEWERYLSDQYDSYEEYLKYQNPERDCTHGPQTSRYGGYYGSASWTAVNYDWKDCAEVDAYINKLWQEKPNRMNVIMLCVVTQWACFLLHFVQFVWACVDTKRWRRGRVSKDAEKLAAQIVGNIMRNGQLNANGNAGMQMPLLAHVQPQPASAAAAAQQAWVPALPARQPESMQAPQPAVVVQEKGEASTRFA